MCELHEKSSKEDGKIHPSIEKCIRSFLNEYGHYIEGGQYYIGSTYFAST